ncbi:hypothetical protein DFH11DRAFT_1304953 [Phellopilus nigrolimitatus]|nr:hypothetical protein DFH11DRAFT_1304953 [Phellopilus nigrolimitatus]
MHLPADAIFDRLRYLDNPTYPVTAPPRLTEYVSTRKHISNTFGGNQYNFISRPDASKAEEHGYTHFLFPNLNMNPHAPQFPGAHGLLFRSGMDDEMFAQEEGKNALGKGEPHKVIVCLGTKHYIYVGDYEFERPEPLSIAQWEALPENVRKKWVEKIFDSRTGLRALTRASVALRCRSVREPTILEVRNLVKTKGRPWKTVTLEDIRKAFDRGEEKIIVWVMKCVGYDEAFQQKHIDGPQVRENGDAAPGRIDDVSELASSDEDEGPPRPATKSAKRSLTEDPDYRDTEKAATEDSPRPLQRLRTR